VRFDSAGLRAGLLSGHVADSTEHELAQMAARGRCSVVVFWPSAEFELPVSGTPCKCSASDPATTEAGNLTDPTVGRRPCRSCVAERGFPPPGPRPTLPGSAQVRLRNPATRCRGWSSGAPGGDPGRGGSAGVRGIARAAAAPGKAVGNLRAGGPRRGPASYC